jgi:hypothetical protein
MGDVRGRIKAGGIAGVREEEPGRGERITQAGTGIQNLCYFVRRMKAP